MAENPYQSPRPHVTTDRRTLVERYGIWTPLALSLTFIVTLLSVYWCIATWSTAERFIFVPGGDVGLGFRSFHGQLQWIEYAPWDVLHLDTIAWTISWEPVIAIECLVLLRLLICMIQQQQRDRDAAA